MNVVIVGHVDHGKSTLIGRLLYDSHALPEDKIAEVQKLFEEYKKRFEFAYFLDSFQDELEEERTIDTTRVMFKGRKERIYTVVDVPGHKEFIRNMLTGASHADVAVLVVSAAEGIQEQTGRHSFLLNLLGIKKIIVAVNKMDTVNYDKDVFEKVKFKASKLLSSFGFSNVLYIPISALEGDNVYQPSDLTQWYKGQTLIETLDEIEMAELEEKPLRFVIQDTYSTNSERIAVGRVESGTIKTEDEIILQPSGVQARVKTIKTFPDELEYAISGDSIGITLTGEAERGSVVGHVQNAPQTAEKFLGEVVLLEGTLKRGDEFQLKSTTNRVKCMVEEIKERINSETGEVIEKNTDEIIEHEAATVIFKTEPLVIEKFSDIPELGRFILVRDGRNIGAGIVMDI